MEEEKEGIKGRSVLDRNGSMDTVDQSPNPRYAQRRGKHALSRYITNLPLRTCANRHRHTKVQRKKKRTRSWHESKEKYETPLVLYIVKEKEKDQSGFIFNSVLQSMDHCSLDNRLRGPAATGDVAATAGGDAGVERPARLFSMRSRTLGML